MSASILVVEDEEPLRVLLTYNLEAEGFRVRAAEAGDEVDRMVEDERPDLILLDWMLPGISGIDLCRMLRSRDATRQVPIIMLTARGEEPERVRGLATGADDYVTKPFSVPELLARIKSLLRRSSPDLVADRLVSGDITLDRVTRRVRRGARDLDLSPTEFKLLEHLMQYPGRVYSREQLLNAVWGHNIYVDERTVDVHVGRLRKALNRGRMADPIRTVRGAGYAFNERFDRLQEKAAGKTAEPVGQ